MKTLFIIQKYALAALVLAGALLVNPFWGTDIFEFPKLIALIVLTNILVITVLIDFVVRDFLPRHPFPQFSKEFIFVFLILIGHIIAFAFSTQREISLIGAPFRFQGFLTHLHYLLLTAAAFFIFLRNPLIKKSDLFVWLIIGLTLTSIISLSPYITPIFIFEPVFFSDRVFGPFGNPNYLAAYIITVLPIFVSFYSRMPKILFIAISALVIATLFLTGSRSAWIASIIGFLIWGIITMIKEKKHRILSAALAISTAVMILFIGQQYIRSPYFERLSITPSNITSLQTRLHLWNAGTRLFLTRPLTGVGHDALKDKIEPYLPEHLQTNDVFFIDRTHSEFIDILAMQGIIGFLGYVIFFGSLIWKSIIRTNQSYAMAAVISLITLQLFHAVNFSTISSNILLYLLAGYLLHMQVLHSKTNQLK